MLDVIVEDRSLDHGGCHSLLVVVLLLLCPIAIFELLLPLLPRENAVRAIHHYHLALLLLFGRIVLIDAFTEWRELNLWGPPSLPPCPNFNLWQGNVSRLIKPVALDAHPNLLRHEGDGGPGF